MRVLYDLFPAFVAVVPSDHPTPAGELSSAPPTKGSRQVNTARVIITDSRIIIATDSPTGPLVVFNEQYDPAVGPFYKSPTKATDSYITTVSGKRLAFKRDDDCGCGSRLRSWNPYRMSDSVKDPSQ